jgi:hypothetical protein
VRIGDSIPFPAFRAYGFPARPAPVAPCSGPDAPQAHRVAQLVGARVAAPASVVGSALEAPAAASAARGAAAYPMYTRAADRVEVAVAIQLGRTVDVRG